MKYEVFYESDERGAALAYMFSRQPNLKNYTTYKPLTPGIGMSGRSPDDMPEYAVAVFLGVTPTEAQRASLKDRHCAILIVDERFRPRPEDSVAWSLDRFIGTRGLEPGEVYIPSNYKRDTITTSWSFFFGDDHIQPYWVSLLSTPDDPSSEPHRFFAAGLKALCQSIALTLCVTYREFDQVVTNKSSGHIIELGRCVLLAHSNLVNELAFQSVGAEWGTGEGSRYWVRSLRSGVLQDEVGERMLECFDSAQFVVVRHADDPTGTTVVKLYGRPDGVDVSCIARQYGGYGIPTKAEFRIPTLVAP